MLGSSLEEKEDGIVDRGTIAVVEEDGVPGEESCGVVEGVGEPVEKSIAEREERKSSMFGGGGLK